MVDVVEGWEGRVAFVTGAASGIGLGIAQAFLEAGMKVALGYRSERPLAKALELLSDASDRVLPIRVDVADRTSMAAATEDTLRAFGKIHVLVNNAGVQDPAGLAEMSYEQWDRMMDINVGGVFNGIHEVLPHIRSHGERGQVVTTASIMSLFPGGAGYGAYCASKYAVLAMMESLYAELRDTPIGVSALCPGLVRSNLEAFLNDLEVAADPLEVGRITLRGMDRNDLYILSHPEFVPVLQARTARIAASVRPEIVVPEERQEIARSSLARQARDYGDPTASAETGDDKESVA